MKRSVFISIPVSIPESKWKHSDEFMENPDLKKLLEKGWRIQKMEDVTVGERRTKNLIQIYLESPNQVDINTLFVDNKTPKKKG